MESQDNLRVASFSAYLNPTDQESFALKIATVVQEAVPSAMSFEEAPRAVSFRTKPDKESEIGTIFGANKYLNVKMEYKSCTKATEQKEQAKSRDCFERTKQRTIDWSFFKECFSCHEPYRGNKPDHEHVHGMVLDSVKHSRVQSTFKKENPDEPSKKPTEEPRKSIEVFGSQAAKRGDDISKNLERKLSMLTWDAIPKKPHKLNHSIFIEADVLSDGSSDLFEIEALSGKNVPSPPPADYVSGSMTPTSQYEPSEVSIDFSFASDFDDRCKAGDQILTKKRGQS